MSLSVMSAQYGSTDAQKRSGASPLALSNQTATITQGEIIGGSKRVCSEYAYLAPPGSPGCPFSAPSTPLCLALLPLVVGCSSSRCRLGGWYSTPTAPPTATPTRGREWPESLVSLCLRLKQRNERERLSLQVNRAHLVTMVIKVTHFR